MSPKLNTDTTNPSKSTFTGFNLPDGAWLPPELIYLLPNISGPELKVLGAVLYTYMQIIFQGAMFIAGAGLMAFLSARKVKAVSQSNENRSMQS
jgi:hypothetical protein